MGDLTCSDEWIMMKYNHRGSKVTSSNQNMEFGPFRGGSVVACISRTYIIQMYLSVSVKSNIKGV